MGAACCKSSSEGGGSRGNADGVNGESANGAPGGENQGTLGVMFHRFDKERKGYISLKNLQDMMKDDKTHFQGKDATHIMDKYGTDNKMTFENFKTWWNSTYTTYNEDDLKNLVDEVNAEAQQTGLESVPEFSTLKSPHNSNVAVSRS